LKSFSYVKEFGKRKNEEDANLISASPVKPTGLRLVIDFAQCTSHSQNCFHYSITLMAIKDAKPHIYQKNQHQDLLSSIVSN
jgi:hypothetical protein